MSETEPSAAPRRRRTERYREDPGAAAAEPMTGSDAGTRYAVGNAGRGNARFGESQRFSDSQNQWAVPPYVSGSYDPVGAGEQTGNQNPWVSGVHDVVYTPWKAQETAAPAGNYAAPQNPEANR